MKAIVLAGGEGIRLRPYTFVIPKPLLPVGNKPVLHITIEHLRRHGVTEVIVAIGYLGELIKSYFGDGSRHGLDISFVEESQPLGTAGALGLARERLAAGELAIVMNGDVLTKLDFTRVIREHGSPSTDLCMGVRRLENRSPYGVVDLEGGQVRSVVEKPVRVEHVNAGIYLVNERVLRDIPSGRYCTMPDLVNSRLAAGGPVSFFPVDEPWLAVESADHLDEANQHLALWAEE